MDELHEAYDVDVAKLNRLAARSAERAEALKAENEKLRKLVRDMWDVALHPQLFGDGSYLLRRMRDLGIEVEE